MMRNHTLSYFFLLTQTLWLCCPTERMGAVSSWAISFSSKEAAVRLKLLIQHIFHIHQHCLRGACRNTTMITLHPEGSKGKCTSCHACVKMCPVGAITQNYVKS